MGEVSSASKPYVLLQAMKMTEQQPRGAQGAGGGGKEVLASSEVLAGEGVHVFGAPLAPGWP